tara:strand:+ start:187 stop:786 length:600 start_codon:yes stop_codon:yes gene_type:complete
MAKRKAYAPFSLTSEAGVAQTPVEGYIDVEQKIYPTVATGTINENGKWAGVKSTDDTFRGFTKDFAIANGAEVLVPSGSTDPDNFIDMTGFTDIQIAILPSGGGGFAIRAIMGPDTYSYANLKPVNAASRLRGAGSGVRGPADRLDDLFADSADSLTADVWNIFTLFDVLKDQKLLQFSLTNNTGGEVATLEFAYRRLV